MALPLRAVPSGSVTIAGESVAVRGLTMAEVQRVREHKQSDALAIAIATSLKLEEVVAWREAAPAGDCTVLLAKIFELSALDAGGDASAEGAGFPDAS